MGRQNVHLRKFFGGVFFHKVHSAFGKLFIWPCYTLNSAQQRDMSAHPQKTTPLSGKASAAPCNAMEHSLALVGWVLLERALLVVGQRLPDKAQCPGSRTRPGHRPHGRATAGSMRHRHWQADGPRPQPLGGPEARQLQGEPACGAWLLSIWEREEAKRRGGGGKSGLECLSLVSPCLPSNRATKL